jgi:hypothetical protein
LFFSSLNLLFIFFLLCYFPPFSLPFYSPIPCYILSFYFYFFYYSSVPIQFIIFSSFLPILQLSFSPPPLLLQSYPFHLLPPFSFRHLLSLFSSYLLSHAFLDFPSSISLLYFHSLIPLLLFPHSCFLIFCISLPIPFAVFSFSYPFSLIIQATHHFN